MGVIVYNKRVLVKGGGRFDLNGAVMHMTGGGVSYFYALLLIIGSVTGALIAPRVLSRVNRATFDRVCKPVISLIMILMRLQMIF